MLADLFEKDEEHDLPRACNSGPRKLEYGKRYVQEQPWQLAMLFGELAKFAHKSTRQ